MAAGTRMDLREQTLEILKEKFGTEQAYKVLDYIDSRVRTDVATEKDIYELKLEIEKVRADLRTEIEKVRADLRTEIEKNRTEIEKVKADLIKWAFGFWITQMAVLVGILFKLLS
jgi:septal ring factor EnvC (AmiA/AmiB activator)